MGLNVAASLLQSNVCFPPIADIRRNIHARTVRRRNILWALAVAAILALVTLPIWGMGLAVFLDAKRTVLARHPSPDGRRIAQVERMVVGGVPSIVVIVRSWWMPDWYLGGCVAASHYENMDARVVWKTNNSLVVQTRGDVGEWTRSAPFKGKSCSQVETAVVPLP
jgi:hypothetical protein